MKLSIIIPSYNQREFLPETIESALAQVESTHTTYIPIKGATPEEHTLVKKPEIIVIDDGSTDGSLEVAKEYIPFGVKVISQVNKGLASARNTGIMNATGEYILPLDSDDFLKENCVERIIEVAEKTNADIIAPSIHCFGLAEQTTILKEAPTLEDFKAGNRLSYCSAIKRSVLLEVGGYSPRMVEGWEDLHLWYNLLLRGKKIVTIPEPLMFYRTKEQSMWRDSTKHSVKLWDQIIKDFPEVASHRK